MGLKSPQLTKFRPYEETKRDKTRKRSRSDFYDRFKLDNILEITARVNRIP